MFERVQPDPHPVGWYCLVPSADLRPGDVVTKTFMDREIVVWRTANGTAVANTAYCPHLGAHLGRGGVVEGESLQCPFHAFRFSAGGACLTAYGQGVPKTLALGTIPLVERNGFVLGWHHPSGEAPQWEIPVLDPAGWHPVRTHTWSLPSHPQETSENSVDLGHFSVVHGYHDVEVLRRPRTVGPVLTARYGMTRREAGVAVRAEFDVRVHGLGYSQVRAEIPRFDLVLRTFVLATPTRAGHIDLTVGLSHRVLRRSSVLGRLGRIPGVDALFGRVSTAAYVRDVSQDLDLWTHKTWVRRPRLARGDGAIGLYRSWCRQFYPLSAWGGGENRQTESSSLARVGAVR